MQGIEHTLERPVETSMSDGVNRTHSSCVANLLDTFELIISNNVYPTQCRVLNIQSDERLMHH